MPTHPPTDQFSSYSIEANDNDIAAILNILKERYKVIFLFFICAAALSIFYVSRAQPQYVAKAQVMMTASNNTKQSSIVQSLLSTGRLDVADLLSQIEIIKSPTVIRMLVERENLYRVSELGGTPNAISFEMMSARQQNVIIKRTLGRLTILPVLGTSLVNISYRSADPALAAEVVNALIFVYAQQEKQTIIDQASSASGWLASRLDDLREEVKEAERALENERNKLGTNLTGSRDSRLAQIERLTEQLAGAEARYAQTQAKLDKVQQLVESDSDLESLADVTNSRLIQTLRGDEADLLRRRAMLSKRYGPNHPEMIAINAELSVFQDKINSEIDTILLGFENQAAIDRRAIQELKNSMDTYRKSYQADSENRMEIRQLETKVDQSRSLLNSFMASYLESQQRLNLDKDPLRVITSATVPLSPTYPKKSLIVVLSALTGLFMGMFIALIMERVQFVFQNVRQVENYLGIPVYGVLPRMKNVRKQSPMDYILDHPASSLAEMVRSLYMAIKLRDPHRKSGGRVVTLTSTLPDEGKTTTASWLATVASQGGEKVLIIDADMRRPSLHKAFDIGNNKGIADYLSDRLPLEETIYKNHSSGVHIMTGKAIPTHALTLLTSDRMDNLIRRLRDMYDLIIIDAPTSMIFSDSRVVAKLSDKTFYIIEWKKTRRDQVLSCVKQFTDMNYNDLAVILSKTDRSKFMTRRNGDLAYMYQSQK